MDIPPPDNDPNPDFHEPLEDRPLPESQDQEERNWAMICQLAGLAHLVGGAAYGLNIVGPLVVWLVKKDEMPFVDYHGKQAINFQITVTIVQFALAILTGILMSVCIGVFLIPVLVVIWIGQIVFTVIAAIKARDGLPYEFPWTYPFLK